MFALASRVASSECDIQIDLPILNGFLENSPQWAPLIDNVLFKFVVHGLYFCFSVLSIFAFGNRFAKNRDMRRFVLLLLCLGSFSGCQLFTAILVGTPGHRAQ